MGDPRLAVSIERFVPTDQLEAVFAAVRKARHGWLGAAFVFVAFLLVSGRSNGSALTSALLSGAAVGAAAIVAQMLRPRPVVVAVTARSLIVVEMGRLRVRRAMRIRATLSRSETPLNAVPSRTPARQELTLGDETYLAGGASADVVRRLISVPPPGHTHDAH